MDPTGWILFILGTVVNHHGGLMHINIQVLLLLISAKFTYIWHYLMSCVQCSSNAMCAMQFKCQRDSAKGEYGQCLGTVGVWGVCRTRYEVLQNHISMTPRHSPNTGQ